MSDHSEECKTVYVVDDDESVRTSLRQLLRSVSLDVELFASADEFLTAMTPEMSGCLIVDVRMPGMSGIELQKELVTRGSRMPIIIMTAHGEVSMAVDSMRNGAIDFMQKPYSPQVLLDRIREALAMESNRRTDDSKMEDIRRRLDSLSSRETEVMERLISGLSTKEIAHDLGIGLTTVDYHRSNTLEKMDVSTVVELGRVVERLRSAGGEM